MPGQAVSVYLPTRNRLTLLRRAISSVLAQSYSAFELIVVDDASDDGTADTLAEMARGDRRIRPIYLRAPVGACAARNAAIESASGRWITGCDDDDFFEPHRLAELVAAWNELEQRGETASALFTPFWVQDGPSRFQRNQPDVADLTTCKTCNGVGNQIFTLTTTMRSVGGFDPSMPAWQDFELWVRIISRVGPMRRVGSCSYVQDLGHGLARISDDHGARIRAAYDAMAGKHRALYSRRELALLYLNYLTYEQVSLSLGDVMYGLRSGVGLQYAGALYSKAKARARLRFATRSA